MTENRENTIKFLGSTADKRAVEVTKRFRAGARVATEKAGSAEGELKKKYETIARHRQEKAEAYSRGGPSTTSEGLTRFLKREKDDSPNMLSDVFVSSILATERAKILIKVISEEELERRIEVAGNTLGRSVEVRRYPYRYGILQGFTTTERGIVSRWNDAVKRDGELLKKKNVDIPTDDERSFWYGYMLGGELAGHRVTNSVLDVLAEIDNKSVSQLAQELLDSKVFEKVDSAVRAVSKEGISLYSFPVSEGDGIVEGNVLWFLKMAATPQTKVVKATAEAA